MSEAATCIVSASGTVQPPAPLQACQGSGAHSAHRGGAVGACTGTEDGRRTFGRRHGVAATGADVATGATWGSHALWGQAMLRMSITVSLPRSRGQMWVWSIAW